MQFRHSVTMTHPAVTLWFVSDWQAGLHTVLNREIGCLNRFSSNILPFSCSSKLCVKYMLQYANYCKNRGNFVLRCMYYFCTVRRELRVERHHLSTIPVHNLIDGTDYARTDKVSARNIPRIYFNKSKSSTYINTDQYCVSIFDVVVFVDP